MEHCHDPAMHSATANFINLGEYGIIITLFLTGLAGSLSHCIGMCGPFAVAQMSSRLMNLDSSKMQQWEKVKASLLWPYYFGKALTYCAMYSLLYLGSSALKDIAVMRYMAFAFLMVVAFLFVKAAFNQKFVFWRGNSLLNGLFKKISTQFAFNSYGLKGVLTGAVLGLIPCGLVYASIATAVSAAENYWLGMAAVFAFAMSTIPGLFIAAFIGANAFAHLRKYFRVIYATLLIFNGLLIVQYALKLI